jgi:hypothetical protein
MTSSREALPPTVLPARLIDRGIRTLPDASRGMGIFFCAARGSGKSRALGRLIAWQDFSRGMPVVIIDPLGGTIDNFLDKISRRPLEEQRKLWKRVRYVNMNGQDGRVVPWPIYYEAEEGERYSDRSKRFVDVIARSDPQLANASIQGLNALAPVAEASGIILSALGLGITELWSLVDETRLWEDKLRQIEGMSPEVAQAVHELRSLGKMHKNDKDRRLTSLHQKLSMFQLADNSRAIFGATTPGIDWDEVLKKKQAVLLDLQDLHNAQKRKFSLLWVYNSFMTFIKIRGHGHQRQPVSFIIDELSELVGIGELNADVLAGDINELINRIARSHGVWVTLATQELFQLPEKVRNTVLSLGTLIFGQTSDDEAAEEISRRFCRYDPYMLKKRRGMFTTIRAPIGPYGRGPYKNTDILTGEQTTEFTKGEQNYFKSRELLDLKKYHFLIGHSEREGQLATSLRPMSTEKLDPGQYPDDSKIDRIRSELMRRDGIPEQQVLGEIETRCRSGVPTLRRDFTDQRPAQLVVEELTRPKPVIELHPEPVPEKRDDVARPAQHEIAPLRPRPRKPPKKRS